MNIKVLYDSMPDTDVTFHEADIAAVKVDNNFKVLTFDWEKFEGVVQKCGKLIRTMPDDTVVSIQLYKFHGEASELSMKKFGGLKFLELDIKKVNITVKV